MNLNDSIVYLKHVIGVMKAEVQETPMTHAQFTRDVNYLRGTSEKVVARKIVGKDFHGIQVDTPHGRIAFMAIYVNGQGWKLSIASTSAADAAYGLANYRWNEKHLHMFFSEHLGIALPKGTFIAHNEMVSLSPFEVEPHHAVP